MSSVHLMFILIAAISVLFLVSSILVSKLFSLWIHIDSLGGDFRPSKRKIKTFSVTGLLVFISIFSLFALSLNKIREENLPQYHLNDGVTAPSSALISTFNRHTEVFTAALANIDVRLLRYSGRGRS